MKTIVLASGSPRRKEILEKTGLQIVVDPSNYDENLNQNIEPNELAKALSLGKAKDVAKRHKNAIVIGADLVISFNKKVLGKPHTKEKALEMLSELSGNVHSAITGYTIIDTDTGKIISDAVETKIYFRKLSKGEIEPIGYSRDLKFSIARSKSSVWH